MTPGARFAASIEILDKILAGAAAEKTLTRWARASRFAGSGDRAAIRDQVFGALRCKRSYGFIGNGENGRALMVGLLKKQGLDAEKYFSGEKYTPARLTGPENTTPNLSKAPRAVRLDCQDWLLDLFDSSLGDEADKILKTLQSRAPVFLRVNITKTNPKSAMAVLAEDEIETEQHGLCVTALKVTKFPRRVLQSRAYKNGLVELQDVASQAVVGELPLQDGQRVLDFCAGGGGKSLAMAALAKVELTAHDRFAIRMNDLPTRAKRAAVEITLAKAPDLVGKTFELVLCDAPCSGSGSWRRSPDAKWRLTPERLNEFVDVQASILSEAQDYVAKSGVLAYVTCSLFDEENEAQVTRFLAAHKLWKLSKMRHILPTEGGDGFFIAIFRRDIDRATQP